uniref:40S ribosomal protein S21 n=1 Tax=Gopherus agassizii TaxID=38772 RepID=A0A452GW52_9SAUR
MHSACRAEVELYEQWIFQFTEKECVNKCRRDHASIQMNISEVDKVTGRVNGQFKTYAICGAIRRMGESDDSILRLAKHDGIVSKNF